MYDISTRPATLRGVLDGHDNNLGYLASRPGRVTIGYPSTQAPAGGPSPRPSRG